MRNSIDIIPNPNLKGLNCIFPTLPSITPNTVLKLTQNNNSIYTRYSPSSSSSSAMSSTSNKVQVPTRLCQLNNIKVGSMMFEPIYNVQPCHRLAVYVSKLDWQIINNKASRLEEEFMNQVDLVWRGAIIPLYYDKSNSVVLRIQCEGLGFLQENSELEILVQEDKQENNQKVAKQKQYCCQTLVVLPIPLLQTGNINKIKVLKNHQMFTEPSLRKLPSSKTQIKSSKKIQQKQQVEQNNSKSPQYNLPQVIEYSNLNERYAFELLFNYQIETNKFPCDTNVVSLKQQLLQIGRMKNSQGGSLKKESPNLQKLLVEVEVIQDIDHISKQCYMKTGKQVRTHRCVKQLTKQQSEEPEKQMSEKSEKSSSIKSSILEAPQQLRYQARTPKEELEQKSQENIIIMNEILATNFKINLNSALKLRRIQRNQQLENSKKLQYLLKMKEFGIKVCVADKQDEEKLMEDTKSDFISQFMNKLTQNQMHCNNQPKNSITIFSKIPYALKSSRNKTMKFAYISLNQNQKIISDPITVFHSQTKQKLLKNKEQKQKQVKSEQKIRQDEIKELKEKLMKVVKVDNYFYKGENQGDNVQTKVGILTKLDGLCWNRGQKGVKQNQGMMVKDSSVISQGKNIHETFAELYKICYQKQIKKLLSLLPQKSPPPPYPTPILITSFSNNGKTVMNTILREHNYRTLYIDISQMDNTAFVLENLTQYLQLVFQLYDGDFLFMDNLDSVCYKIDAGDLHRKEEMIAAKLIMRRIMEFSKVYKKTCIFTAKNQANIDEQFQNYQLIKLKNPTREIRAQVLHQYHKNNKENQNREKVQEIIQNSQSMSFGQFSKYIISGHKAEGGESAKVVDFSKLAGIKEAKNTLRTIVERPLKYSFVFKRLPIKLSRGVLLYGGSGTGKSAIGQALAGQFKMKFFSVKGSDILSKYIGGSEAAVRDIFQKAMTVSPSIIFFDEFESIVPRRNSSNTSVTDRVVNQFLCYLDGVASVEGVYIVAASSRPELIDPALLRPGRIDTHIFLDHPTKEQREQLLDLFRNSISFQTPIPQILDLTQYYSYSDLIGLIKQLRIKQSARVIKQNANNMEFKVDARQFKFISDKFLRQILATYKVALSKQVKMKEREGFLAFKRGDVQDVSKQKTMLR